MSNDYLKVSPSQNVKEALECMHDGQQSCVIVVGAEGYLEGILTYADVKRSLFKSHGDSSNSDLSVTDVCALDCHHAKCLLMFSSFVFSICFLFPDFAPGSSLPARSCFFLI